MPHTSSDLNRHNKKKIKSKEFINETESSSSEEEEETNSEKELNILSRPKRNIILNMDGLIAAQTMPDTDSDEDDEDFKIDFKSDDDDDDSDNSSSRSSRNSNDEVNEQKEVKVETKIEKKKTKKATIRKQKTPSKTTLKKKGTQIRKNKIKKLIEMKKIESNQEIEKIFSKFKNVNKNTKNIKNSTTSSSSTTNILNKQIQKEKLPPIIDPLNLKDWICSLCHNKPNAFDYLGPLFGPYRISLASDDSWSDDIKSEQDFKEVWLHENCAIWNPSIFIKENQVFGIAKCLKTASEMKCISCKKTGATVTCNRLGCTRSYHYPCAIQNNCNLVTETLNLQCKIHSA